MERAVSRGELHSPASTPVPDSDAELTGRPKDTSDFHYVTIESALAIEVPAEEEDLDFRLFSSTKTEGAGTAAATANKIRLRSPTPQNAEPGFVVAARPLSYYFDSASLQAKDEFSASALSGKEVIALSRKPCPGNAYNWKVLHLPPSAQSASTKAQNALLAELLMPGCAGGEKRKRLGKKSRIRVRVKLVSAAARLEKIKAEAEGKDAAEREKRVRRNREKKLKKRAKEKALKDLGNGAGAGEAAQERAENGDSDD
ncbi:hypothetical protein LTR62_007195 [Meristemomyces frigidus]|uniref:Uncharacterized protein n=1 Tax=Meristemomyces frigidus TaxID=1508187 RepID=A0AAN7TJ28_9PEZI|nr:hypothetical protein LTR62_007195 [Meristemomyces frigidus]